MTLKYRLAQKLAPIGGGASGSYRLFVGAVGKEPLPHQPYVLVNETICAKIGHLIGLPIPPCATLIEKGSLDRPWFASLTFTLDDDALPPIIPSEFVTADPRVATGIILFDIFVANYDRHPGNLAMDTFTNPPTVNLFDHSHALFGNSPGQGIIQLKAMEQHLGTGNHCLMPVLNNAAFMHEWLERIQGIPAYYIEDICRAHIGESITEEEGKAVIAFLKQRQKNLNQLLKANQGAFSQISQWSLL